MTNYRHSPENLDIFDAFQTPQSLASMCVATLREKIALPPHLIIEPSAGRGAFVKAARSEWGPSVEIRAVDIDPTAEPHLIAAGANTVDIVDWDKWTGGVANRTLILGNPPFRWSTRHIEVGLQRLGDTSASEPLERYLGFVLNGQFFLGGLDRWNRVMKRGSLRYVWGIVGRPKYWSVNQQRFGGSSENAFCVWQAGWRGPYEGGWLEWR